jgi:hypothetical protein
MKIKEKLSYIVVFLLSLSFFGWWLYNFFVFEPGDRSLELYSDTYWLVALLGVLLGFRVARLWGGFKSIFGRALYLFSLGLLAQVFGQVTYSYYALVKGVEAPYPSFGDIGYFGSVILYIAAILTLSGAIGAKFKYANLFQKTVSVLAPLTLLAGSYFIFLKGYERCFEDDETLEVICASPVQTFLDFGYPLGQAFYVALALLAFVLSFRFLGGTMKYKILLILFALLIQYLADFTYLYQFSKETLYTGGVSDLLYQVAYLLMTIALLRTGSAARQLSSNVGKNES